MTLAQAYKEARAKYPTTSAHQCLLMARGVLKARARHRFDLSDDPQTLTHNGFFVVVKVVADDDHEWDDDYRGEIHGFSKRYDVEDVTYYGLEGEFVFSRSTGPWDSDEELVGFDLGGGETFNDLLRYYRKNMSKQVAFETAMRDVKRRFQYALDIHEQAEDRYTQHYEAYGVIARVYESEEAYEEDEDNYLGDSDTWGIEVDTGEWKEAQEYVSEVAWDCIGSAILMAQRAEYDKLLAAGNAPLFEGV